MHTLSSNITGALAIPLVLGSLTPLWLGSQDNVIASFDGGDESGLSHYPSFTLLLLAGSSCQHFIGRTAYQQINLGKYMEISLPKILSGVSTAEAEYVSEFPLRVCFLWGERQEFRVRNYE